MPGEVRCVECGSSLARHGCRNHHWRLGRRCYGPLAVALRDAGMHPTLAAVAGRVPPDLYLVTDERIWA